MPGPTVFVAGTIQGRSVGTDIRDQAYRATIRRIILGRYPAATIICPYALIRERFDSRRNELLKDLEAASAKAAFLTADCSADLQELRRFFDQTTRLVANADLLVAFVPEHEPSMGTAIELWCAHAANRVVISITPMIHNLAILATSDAIVPSLDAFADLITAGDWLDRELRLRGEEPGLVP